MFIPVLIKLANARATVIMMGNVRLDSHASREALNQLQAARAEIKGMGMITATIKPLSLLPHLRIPSRTLRL